MAVLRISGIVRVCLGILAKFKRIRRWLVAPVLPTHEKRSGDKRVESRFTLRLDEGSIPSSSTMYFRTNSENSRQTSDYQAVPRFYYV